MFNNVNLNYLIMEKIFKNNHIENITCHPKYHMSYHIVNCLYILYFIIYMEKKFKTNLIEKYQMSL